MRPVRRAHCNCIWADNKYSQSAAACYAHGPPDETRVLTYNATLTRVRMTVMRNSPSRITFSLGFPTVACTRSVARSIGPVLSWIPSRPFSTIPQIIHVMLKNKVKRLRMLYLGLASCVKVINPSLKLSCFESLVTWNTLRPQNEVKRCYFYSHKNKSMNLCYL